MARFPNLLDVANAMEPDGSIAAVAEVLHQTNEMIPDIPMIEGNLPVGHRTVIRTGLPTATWRKLYGGVQPDKAMRQQITDSIGNLEAYAEIDKDLADLNGNTSEFRMQEATAFLETMSQDMQETTLYGDTDLHPERFMGIMPRFNSLSAANAENIIPGGGSGADNGSILLVVWAPDKVHGIFPKGSQAGISMRDMGEVTVENADGSGGRMQAYRTHFKVQMGLSVRDWRYIVRICNIDKSLLVPDASTGANLPRLMFRALERLPNLNGNAAFYMSRSMRTMWREQMAESLKQSTLQEEQVGGLKSPTFQGIPVRRVDKMAADEAAVV